MTSIPTPKPGPYDLRIERVIKAPRALVWEAWTNPEYLKQWWVPKPWTVPSCEIDLRPGGIFRTEMRGPGGEDHPENSVSGCFLDVRPLERIVFTDALGPGWRPNPSAFMTAYFDFADDGNGTAYSAMAFHKDQADRDRHAEMGFFDGWGAVTEQLAALAERLNR